MEIRPRRAGGEGFDADRHELRLQTLMAVPLDHHEAAEIQARHALRLAAELRVHHGHEIGTLAALAIFFHGGDGADDLLLYAALVAASHEQ